MSTEIKTWIKGIAGFSSRVDLYNFGRWLVLALMGVIALIFYKEPPRDAEAEAQRSLGEVFRGMIEVVGNGRFFLLVAGSLLLLVMGSKWLEPKVYLPAFLAWVVLNLLVDVALRQGDRPGRFWLLQPLKVGEGRYLVFLVLMAFFWTSFNQIFMTLPEYIRDYVDTSDLIAAFGPLASGITGTVLYVDKGYHAMGMPRDQTLL